MKQQIFSIFLLVVILFGTNSIQGQEDTPSELGAISKGKNMIMVTGGFSSIDDDAGSDRTTEFDLNLDYRVFLLNGLALGIDISQERDIQGDYNSNLIRLGPEVAYFFGKPDKPVIPFVSATFGFLSLSDNAFLSDNPITGNRYNFGVGILFNSSKRVGGVMQLSFQEDIFKENSQQYKLNYTTLSMGLSISLF